MFRDDIFQAFTVENPPTFRSSRDNSNWKEKSIGLHRECRCTSFLRVKHFHGSKKPISEADLESVKTIART